MLHAQTRITDYTMAHIDICVLLLSFFSDAKNYYNLLWLTELDFFIMPKNNNRQEIMAFLLVLHLSIKYTVYKRCMVCPV